MKRLLFLLLIIVVFLVVPVLADNDQLNITTSLGTPVWYIVDYGAGTTASLTSYSFETSVNYATPNQTWGIFGSDTIAASTLLDGRDAIAFAAGVPQNFAIASPANYRYYYIYLESGFYDKSSILTVHFTTTPGVSPTVDAQFVGAPSFGFEALSVWFNDLSPGSPTVWDWNFGDGSAHSTIQNPTHTYTLAGNYTVVLIATAPHSADTETRVNYISIWNATTMPSEMGNTSYITINNYTVYNNTYYNATLVTGEAGRRAFTDSGDSEIFK